MREIKFRAWDTIEKKIRLEALEIKDIGLGQGSVIASKEVQTDSPLIWMQFTGLLDKHGKEIWDGDIVHNKSLSMRGEVKMGFHETALGKHYGWYIHRYMKISKDKASSWESPHWKVIGNIYSNPELLSTN